MNKPAYIVFASLLALQTGLAFGADGGSQDTVKPEAKKKPRPLPSVNKMNPEGPEPTIHSGRQ